MPEISYEYLKSEYKSKLANNGIKILHIEQLDNEKIKLINTEWAKRLGYGKKRTAYMIEATIEKEFKRGNI